MQKNLKTLLKIIILAIIIISLYRIWNFFINANNNSKIENTNISKENNSNSLNYKKFSSSEISKTWVAITTNLWIKYKQKEKLPETIYQELFSIEEVKKNKSALDNAIIAKHMLAIKEYVSLLKTDFKWAITNTNDRKKTLEWIISQLKIRLTNGINAILTLEKQKNIFNREFESLNNQIDSTKAKISSDYKKVDPEAVNEGIERLFKLRAEQNFVRTYIIFLNNFSRNYASLNEYNKTLLNALTINKDAIEKWSYIVIPSSWSNILKEYGLIYTESEFNSMKQNEEK